ncbi:MAG TPA: tetratricopeptide repeat protein [Polyangia bacterium]|nr:tetratricopeptide repeat protein [Polyangia bacterium]
MARLIGVLLALCALSPSVRADSKSDADASKGASLRASGKYAEARALLENATAKDPRALKARLELGLIYRLTGERDLERAIWNRFYDEYDAGTLDKKSARDLTYVALAARYLGGWQDANDTFRDAVDADPKGPAGARANVEWAALFLEKYDAGHAEACLADALKILPDDADAHALMARVKLEQGYDVAGAEHELHAALQKNPRHTGALAIKAELLADNEEYPAALAACAEIEKINPEDQRARELAAAVKLLREDVRGFEAERDRVLKVNPRASSFFHGVAEILVKEHRYVEANTLELEAIKLDPKNFVAQAALGTNLLRLGDDAGGLAALQRAWDGDPYNVRTYNLLNLFEKVIPKAYTLIDGKPFRFRVVTKERPILERYVRTMLAREYGELVKRYGFQPEQPLTIELFDNPEHYAVRTVGLPGLDALGVTFGHVVTALSPSLGKFNWGMTLWHEVGHIFSIQLSRYRVPRWFTEGLSEYETARERPEWTRRTHAELYRALAENKLLSVAELNSAFVRAKDVAHMVIAYHQAAETVSFLIRRWGFDKVPPALRQFAAGKDTPEVIRAMTGLDVKAFDSAFRADLAQRLKVYEGTFFVRNSDFSDVEALKEQIAKHPDDLRATGLYALALVHAHQGAEAQKLIDEALKTGDAQLKAEVVLAAATLALQRKDRAAAKFFFLGLTRNHDGYDARFGLGQIAAAEGDMPEAEKQLALAKKLDPDRAEPYLELAKLYLKTREDDALKELEAAALLDCMDPGPPKLLVEKHAAKGRWQKVVELAPLALFTDPFDVAVHTRLARAYVELGRREDAIHEIEAGLACEATGEQQQALRDLARKIGFN